MPSLPEVTLEMENDGSPGITGTDEIEKQEGEKEVTGERVVCCSMTQSSFSYADSDRFSLLFRGG